jgi:hypothetical protein
MEQKPVNCTSERNQLTIGRAETAITEDQIARIFVILQSIDFAKMRDEFESASVCKKIAAGENALEVALNIASRHGSPKAITANDLEILMPVLNVIAQAAVNGAPSPFPRSQTVQRVSFWDALMLSEPIQKVKS